MVRSVSFHVSSLEGAPALSLMREEQEATPVSGVIRVIDTDSEEGKEQARLQTAPKEAEADEKKPPISVVKISTIHTGAEKEDSEVQPTPEKTPDERTHAAFTSFVTEYFGGCYRKTKSITTW